MDFPSLKDRSTTKLQVTALTQSNEKVEFWLFWCGRRKRQLFFLKLESKLVPVDNFLFSESYVWFLLIPTSIKTSSPFSFTSRLLLPVSSHFSGDLLLEIANPVTPHTIFETHRRASQGVSTPSAHPLCVCFSLRYFKMFSNHQPLNKSVLRRDMRIQNFLLLEWKISVFFPKIL